MQLRDVPRPVRVRGGGRSKRIAGGREHGTRTRIIELEVA